MKRASSVSIWAATMLFVILGMSAAPAMASATPKKHLSQTAVTILGPQTTISAGIWTAAAQGYYKKLGLDATVISAANTAAQTFAELLAGVAQFATGTPSAIMPPIEAGAPVRAVMALQTDTDQELVVNATTAAQKGIPTIGATKAQALKQFQALKGTHLTFGVTGLTSDGYAWFVTFARAAGLVVGTTAGNTASDVNVIISGTTPAALLASYEAGKIDGLINTPPTTIVTTPTSITVQMSNLEPAPKATASYLQTTTSMIDQHPDTVEAVIEGTIQGKQFINKHPGQAEKDIANQFASFGITSPEEQVALFDDFAPFDESPYPSKSGFNYALQLANAVANPPNTISYSQLIYPKLVTDAMKKLGIPV